jgi:uncharacterized protein (TIGR02145 family)
MLHMKAVLCFSAMVTVLIFSCFNKKPTAPDGDSQTTFIAAGPTVTDADGNIYTSIVIGAQTWTVENLRTTKYNDGTAITPVPDNDTWHNLYTTESTSGLYCYYENSTANKAKYGALYNWYAVGTGKLAPEGWHVPADSEWTTLENYLIANGYNWDGTTTGKKIAKSMAAQTDWSIHTIVGTIGKDLAQNNATGFSALPGGSRLSDGSFYGLSYSAVWWSATEYDESRAYDRGLGYQSAAMPRNLASMGWGLSVRLLRD